MKKDYDIVIVGGGPGGYVAALKASEYGLRTAIIDKSTRPENTCLHLGCIPTKSLLHAADILNDIKGAAKFGITASGVRVDWQQIQKYKDRIISINASGISSLLKKNKVSIFCGLARIKSKHEIEVKENKKLLKISAKNIILSVGSAPKSLPHIDSSNNKILTSDTIFALDHIPGSLTIIGGGIIGVEFASAFARFGTKVTILEFLPTILKGTDIECSKELAKQFNKQQIDIHTNSNVTNINQKKMITCKYHTKKKTDK